MGIKDLKPVAGVQRYFKATLAENIAYGQTLDIQDVYDAQIGRTLIYHGMRTFLRDFDVLACPVVGLPPGPVEEEYPETVDGRPMADYVEWLRFSFLATTAALPALSLPAGFTADGLPVGLQLIGPPRGDAKLLRVARFIEDALSLPSTPADPSP